jgi:hypothetical protein
MESPASRSTTLSIRLQVDFGDRTVFRSRRARSVPATATAQHVLQSTRT